MMSITKNWTSWSVFFRLLQRSFHASALVFAKAINANCRTRLNALVSWRWSHSYNN